MQAFEEWLVREYDYAGRAMRESISPVHIVKERPGFGQTIRPVPGAIVASTVLASYDPDPDYFFHWFRDSAIIIDALRILYEDGSVGAEALGCVADFTRFSLALRLLDGRALVALPAWRARVTEDFVRFLRLEIELNTVYGDAIAGETRVNADGSLDISSWTRPQHDGAPLRALALLRWLRSASFEGATALEISTLIRADLEFTRRRARVPAFDMWEEDKGLHFHTLCVCAAALEQGAAWLDSAGTPEDAQACRAEAATIRSMLDGFWLAHESIYRSRVLESGVASPKELDIAVILAAIHGGATGPHSPGDSRMHSTLARLEQLFDAAYPINHRRAAGTQPAMGRYAGDSYYSGGAYYFSTLGAAEFCFKAALVSEDPAAWIARGDGYLQTVRTYTPETGELSEQFDQRTGAQTSARHLAWSYAAFISCIAARRAVLAGSASGRRP
jgi:glucoamylase